MLLNGIILDLVAFWKYLINVCILVLKVLELLKTVCSAFLTWLLFIYFSMEESSPTVLSILALKRNDGIT